LITWDDAEAEDLVQECLLRVSRRWRRVRGMDLPLAYARRILINLALAGRDQRFRRRIELGRPEEASGFADVLDRPDVAAEAELDALERRSELLSALELLTPTQRTVLALRYFEDLSEAQVADLLGCSTGTVKSSASRGLARLRDRLPTSTSTSTSEVVIDERSR
jgi:RNA polymerase sigma factor (sigma-70 family)